MDITIYYREESPGIMKTRRRGNPGWSNPLVRATEKKPPEYNSGKDEKVR